MARRAREQGTRNRAEYHERQGRQAAKSAAVIGEMLANLKVTAMPVVALPVAEGEVNG